MEIRILCAICSLITRWLHNPPPLKQPGHYRFYQNASDIQEYKRHVSKAVRFYVFLKILTKMSIALSQESPAAVAAEKLLRLQLQSPLLFCFQKDRQLYQ